MKKRCFVHRPFLAAGTLLLLVAACSQQREPDNGATPEITEMAMANCMYPASSEPAIDLTPHEMDEDTGNFEISEFAANVRTSAGAISSRSVNIIENDHFCLLRERAEDIASAQNCTASVAALKIIFGLTPDLKKVELVYQPVSLCLTQLSGNTATFSVQEGSSPQYYTYDPGGFSSGANLVAAQRYREASRMKHRTGTAFRSFVQDTNVVSIIFSFQEIGKLIDDNSQDKVVVWNALTKKVVSAGDSLHYHTLLMGASDLTGPQKMLGAFTHRFANLAHLCPPNCVTLNFRMTY